ncbi:MAG: SDR family NAD(P)-dependent oxidoreductase [Polyangiaceae bacterium]|jgi:NAD(P)-dependent dehydrogenase (short-subunit alcohol dehydrogenase family)
MALPKSPRCAITGAGNGFGRALALGLARRGAHLLLSDRSEEDAQETARAALAAGASTARAVKCDVTRYEDVEAFAGAWDHATDLVVNNAGVSSSGLVGELSIDDWRWTLETNLLGVIHGCHVFVPRLRREGRGHILNVASAAAIVAPPRMAAYSVAKAGVVALSETLAAELVGTRIGVTVLCPTFFRTNIAKSGRFTHAEDRACGERLVDRGKDPDFVVRAALASVDRRELYCLPMADGRWLWRLKRLTPERFPVMVGKMSRWVPQK